MGISIPENGRLTPEGTMLCRGSERTAAAAADGSKQTTALPRCRFNTIDVIQRSTATDFFGVGRRFKMLSGGGEEKGGLFVTRNPLQATETREQE